MADYITGIGACFKSDRPQLRPGLYSETITKNGEISRELFIQDVVSINIDDDAQKKELTLRGELIDGKSIFIQIPSGEYQSMTIHGAHFLPATEIQKIGTSHAYDTTHDREHDESNHFSVNLSDSSGIERVSINGSGQSDLISVRRMPKNSLLHIEGSHYNVGSVPADIIYLDPVFSGKLKLTSGCTNKKPKQGSSRDDFQEDANIHAKPIILQGGANGYHQVSYSPVDGKPIVDGSSFLLDFTSNGSHTSRQLK